MKIVPIEQVNVKYARRLCDIPESRGLFRAGKDCYIIYPPKPVKPRFAIKSNDLSNLLKIIGKNKIIDIRLLCLHDERRPGERKRELRVLTEESQIYCISEGGGIFALNCATPDQTQMTYSLATEIWDLPFGTIYDFMQISTSFEEVIERLSLRHPMEAILTCIWTEFHRSYRSAFPFSHVTVSVHGEFCDFCGTLLPDGTILLRLIEETRE